ncbi:MAG: hypothetical protein ACRD2B_11950 [Terriglobia bacterium]
MNALKHGRYARRLTQALERTGEREQLELYWSIVKRISLHFRVDWNREQHKTERLAREVWCYGWKVAGGGRTNPGSPGGSSSSEINSLSPIQIRGNARGSALRFVFGRRRRRRLTARVIPLLSLGRLLAFWRLSSSAFATEDQRDGWL